MDKSVIKERIESRKQALEILLGEPFHAPRKETHFQRCVTLEQLSLVKELRIYEKPTFPHALFLAIARLATGNSLRQIRFLAPLHFVEGETRVLHTIARDIGSPLSTIRGGEEFDIYSTDENFRQWMLHCSGTQENRLESVVPDKYDLAEVKKHFQTPVDFRLIYDQMTKVGMSIGENMRGIIEAWSTDDGSLLAHIRCQFDTLSNEYLYSMPVLIESCFHLVLALFKFSSEHLPIITSIEDMSVSFWPSSDDIWCSVQRQQSADHIADIAILNDQGNFLMHIRGIRIGYSGQ